MSDPQSRFSRSPRRTRKVLLTIVGAAVVVVVAVVALVYFVIFPTSSPKPFSLTTSSSTSSPSSSASSQAGASSAAQLVGRWTVGSGSAAGYCVRENLGFLHAHNPVPILVGEQSGGSQLGGTARGPLDGRQRLGGRISRQGEARVSAPGEPGRGADNSGHRQRHFHRIGNDRSGDARIVRRRRRDAQERSLDAR